MEGVAEYVGAGDASARTGRSPDATRERVEAEGTRLLTGLDGSDEDDERDAIEQRSQLPESSIRARSGWCQREQQAASEGKELESCRFKLRKSKSTLFLFVLLLQPLQIT